VHAIQSAEAFVLAQNVWQHNARSLVLDAPNRKECLRFVFSNPTCVVWLQRDQGRTDTFELILLWEGNDPAQEKITEVYVIAMPQAESPPAGDDTRAKSLLTSILASPATVPVQYDKRT
jgi:hypothetical protein